MTSLNDDAREHENRTGQFGTPHLRRFWLGLLPANVAMSSRRDHVKVLRSLARKRDVAQVRDVASRETVMAMVAELRKLPLEQAERQQLEDTVSDR